MHVAFLHNEPQPNIKAFEPGIAPEPQVVGAPLLAQAWGVSCDCGGPKGEGPSTLLPPRKVEVSRGSQEAAVFNSLSMPLGKGELARRDVAPQATATGKCS